MIPIYQIHPAIVHFPITLFVAALVLDVIIVARGGNIADRVGLAVTSMWVIWVGVVSAVAAVIFGGIAEGHAADAGFPSDPIETHQGFAQITLLTFLALAIIQSVCRWRNISLAGGRGWIFSLLVLVGVGLIITTAYYGGHLVYSLGVNVDPVKP